jgi:hypothetical protein
MNRKADEMFEADIIGTSFEVERCSEGTAFLISTFFFFS